MDRRPELLREAGANFAELVRQAPLMVGEPALVDSAAKAVQGLMEDTAEGLAEALAEIDRQHEQYVALLSHFISFVDLQRAMIEALLETGDTGRARASLPLLHNLSFRLQMGRTGITNGPFDEEEDE